MSEQPEPKRWRNRITGYGEEDPAQLLANPANFRRHPGAQQETMRGALAEIGWLQEVIVNTRTGHLLDGHMRIELALREGVSTIPVKYVDLSPAEENAALATFDPIAEMAYVDAQALVSLLQETSAADEAVRQMLANQLAFHEPEVATVRSLDDLAEEFGEFAEHSLWPVIRLQVPPSLKDRFAAVMKTMPGSDDHERLAALLDHVDADRFREAGAHGEGR